MKQSELNKLIDGVIKPLAKRRGWKFSRGFVFQRTNHLFFSLLFLGRAKSNSLSYVLWYKWYDFDDLFWKIVLLPENADQPLSFRAAGAWTVPQTEVASGHQTLEALNEGNIHAFANDVFERCEKIKLELTEKLTTLADNLTFLRESQAKHIEEYPGSLRDIYVQEALTAILQGNRNQALKLIEERIALGDTGGFTFGSKTFFTAARDWIVSH